MVGDILGLVPEERPPGVLVDAGIQQPMPEGVPR
jgi:hypothetical protein